MATVHIDRLLEAVIKMGGSDLHIVTGRPPILRIRGRLRSLDTKVLESEDTSSRSCKMATPRVLSYVVKDSSGKKLYKKCTRFQGIVSNVYPKFLFY